MDSKLPKPSGLKRPAPPTMTTTTTAATAAAATQPATTNTSTGLRSMIPSDRLNQQPLLGHHTSFSTAAAHTNATIAGGANQKMPLTATDFLNMPRSRQLAGQKRRYGSPDNKKQPPPPPPAVGRAKLRRSRSATELRRRSPPPPLASRLGAGRLLSGTGSGVSGCGQSLDSVPPKLSKSATSLRLQPPGAAKPKLAPILSRLPSASAQASASSRLAAGGVANAKQRPAIGASVKRLNATTSTVAAAATASTAAKPATMVTGKKFAPYDYKGRLLDLQERFKALKDKYERSQEQHAEYLTVADQLEDSQTQLFRSIEQLRSAESETGCLRQQLAAQDIKLDSLAASVADKTAHVQRLLADCERLGAECAQMRPELVELRDRRDVLEAQLAAQSDELAEAQESLFRSNMDRKELHNVVMDLRGNIRVFCRVRPPLAGSAEEQRQLCGWQYLDEASLEISTAVGGCGDGGGGGAKRAARHEFSFDQVFHPRSSQSDIFELVSPLIQSALDGYNVCIFAYGQTGSGKTFTMDGVPEQLGIIPRTVDLLFDCIRNYRRIGWEYVIKVTFLEIYNEVLYDLLSNDTKDMDIRMVSAKTPTEIYVSNITEVTVATADELRSLMQLAKANRATAATVGNERSSRSHAVTRIQLVGRHAGKQESSVGNINLVDLAGSESPKTSTRMEETKKINKSLSELTNVIMALMQRLEHIPYRNSKLTHLLMPCLGGNSKTLMFINVAPFQDCFVESVKSLRFAASVNSCKVVKAKRNKFLNMSAND